MGDLWDEVGFLQEQVLPSAAGPFSIPAALLSPFLLHLLLCARLSLLFGLWVAAAGDGKAFQYHVQVPVHYLCPQATRCQGCQLVHPLSAAVADAPSVPS